MIKKIAVILLVLLFQAGCKQNNNYREQIFMGVIETTCQAQESYITFFDKDLNYLFSEKFEFGSMGSPFNLPKIIDGYMYVIPKGLINKDLKILLEYDLKTGKKKTYDTGQNCINSFAVGEEEIYTVNTKNNESVICKYNKYSGKKNFLCLKSIYICKIEYYEGILYAFGETADNKAYLYEIETYDLKIQGQYDISECGTAQADTLKYKDILYFTSQYEINGQPGFNLSAFNLNDKSLTNYMLEKPFPYQIINHNNKLYISHFDLVYDQGKYLSVFDPVNKNNILKEFVDDIGQIYISNDIIFSADSKNMRIYDINNFNIMDSFKLNFIDDNKKYFYFSSFFLIF